MCSRLEENIAALVLYWLHWFPLACLMFSEKLCCVRHAQFQLGNLSEVGAQHITSVSDDCVKPILFFFLSSWLWESHYSMGNKVRKGRFDIHMALGGSGFLMGRTIILVHMGCSLRCGAWQRHRPTVKVLPALCSITLEFILLGFWASESWQARENIKQQFFCTDCIHFLPSVVRTKCSPTSEKLPSGNWGHLTQRKGARTYT
jgi:hypothetical protein